MVRFNHSDIPVNAPQPGGYSQIKDGIRQARDFVCGLRARYPGAATFPQPPGSASERWANAVWDDLCERSPTPGAPPAYPPFSGGNCVTEYLFQGTQTIRERATGQVYTLNWAQGVSGAVKGVALEQTTDGLSRSYVARDRNNARRDLGNQYSYAEWDFVNFQITSITRVDGLPDNCGDAPRVPDDYVPPFPPPGGQEKPYIPPDPKKPGGGWNIFVPFVYLDPDLTLNVDVGGVNFNFDAGGIEFNFSNEGGNGTPGSGSSPPPDLSGLEEAIEAAKNAAEGAKNAAEGAKNAAEGAKKGTDDRNNNDGDDPQNDPNKQNKEPKEENDPKEEDGIERLLAVEVELLQVPANARVQDGGDAPNVVYAGWFSFRTKGTPHPRSPIHYGRNYFIAPTGADGYGYTVYNGFTARATVITAKASQSED